MTASAMMAAIASFVLLAQVAWQDSAANRSFRTAPDTIHPPSGQYVQRTDGSPQSTSHGSMPPGAGRGIGRAPASCSGAACKRKPNYNNDAGSPGIKEQGLY